MEQGLDTGLGMRVGGPGTGLSSHLAGMSSLWHDADWQPDKSIHIPNVVQKFPDEADLLPSEQHQLPRGFDAFAKLDEVYELAGAQMDRGIEGAQFLHGRRPTTNPDAIAASADARGAEAHDQTRTMVARQSDPDRKVDVRAVQDARAIDDQIRKAAEAGNQPTRVSNATETANARHDAAKAVKTLEMAEGIGITMAAVAAGQAMDPASGTLAAEAAAAVKAISTAKTAVGMSRPMEDMANAPAASELRRGLGRRVSLAGEDGDTTVDGAPPRHQPSLEPVPRHQPSLDPGDDDGHGPR